LKNRGQFMTFESRTYDKKLKCMFKGYHVDLESLIGIHMHELWAHESGHKLGILIGSPKIYYRNGGGGIFPSLGHGVFYEFGSFIVHSCTILGWTCLNHLPSFFVKVDFTLNFYLRICFSTILEILALFLCWKLWSAPWVWIPHTTNLGINKVFNLRYQLTNLWVCYNLF
jgi:hypothetical protein